jgi:hypothetical protein
MTNVPNLDCMDVDELMQFLRDYFYPNRSNTKSLLGIPESDNLPRGSKRVVKDLSNYAANKVAAMDCRRRGDVNTAIMYEDICDRIYQKLPEQHRW